MSVLAYINFNGNCLEAVEYYAEVFDTGKPHIMFFRDMPPEEDFPITEETKDLVLHTSLDIEGSIVMFSDLPPEIAVTTGNNISLVIISNDMDRIRSIFSRLISEGTVDMELQETFWTKLYGSVADKFGIVWQLMYDEE